MLTHKGVTIDVSQPSTLAQRKVYIATLQDYFGLNIKADSNKYASANTQFFDLLHSGHSTVPRNFAKVEHYRHFRIVADLLEHAYNGTYRLELLLENVVVGIVPVLSRGEHTHCSACKGRREAHNRVKGHITVHPEVIAKLVGGAAERAIPTAAQRTLSLSSTHKREFTHTFKTIITRSFSARLVGPTGTILATADEDTDPNSEGRTPLPEEKQPIITVHSAAVADDESSGKDRYAFYDHDEYGQILKGKWVSIPYKDRKLFSPPTAPGRRPGLPPIGPLGV